MGGKSKTPKGECSKWQAYLSNRALPPAFFLVAALFIIFILRGVSSETIRINLAAMGITSTAIGVYLLGA